MKHKKAVYGMSEKSVFLKILTALLLVCSFGFGCSTLKPGDIPDQSQWEEPEPLSAGIGIDLFQFRIDIFRERKDAMTSTVLINEDGTYKRKDDMVPHHYLGVYLGGGLFIDINGNVGVDIIRLFGFDTVKGFRMRKTLNGSLDAAEEFSRDGNTITIKEGGWGGGEIVSSINDNSFFVGSGTFFSPDEIIQKDQQIDFIPSGLFSSFRKANIRQSENMVYSSTNYRLEQSEPGKINLNATHEIIREKDRILFNGRGRTIMTIVKSGDRYVFFRSESYGSWIEKLPDKIRIYDNGSLTEYTYELDEPAAPSTPEQGKNRKSKNRKKS
jgi:hypothetical protein